MNTKKLLTLLLLCLALAVTLSLAACTTPDGGATTDDPTAPLTEKATITFDGTAYTSSVENAVKQDGASIIIKRAGTYELSGSFEGQIVVELQKTEAVELILSGLTVTCDTSAPIYIKSADKCNITLAEGTTNTLTDAEFYVFEDGQSKPNACLYSEEDLDIEGNGTLVVNANFNNGIGSKNDLKIKGGSITVNAVKNALKGNDSVSVSAGTVNIVSCTDGIKSDSIDPGKGIVTVSGGTITIDADDDGIQAQQAITISGGSITVDAYGKAINCKNLDSSSVSIAEGCLTVVE